ncbi:hypothetical protein HZB06_01665 [Candidatus Wolfebacteria bacterium]|nr:hypothetical protein [Candidatus Wolfebacteria bacterium]
MAKKSEIFLEEAVLDDLADDYNSLELPLSERVFKLIGAAVFFILLIVGARFFFLTLWKGDFYGKQAFINASQITTVKAERGIIFDRFNKQLVKNIPVFRLNLKVVELLKNREEMEKTAKNIESILGLPPRHLETLIKNVNFEKQDSIALAKNLTVEEVIKIKNLNLAGVKIEEFFDREYLFPEIFSHIIGYVGAVTKKDLDANPDFSLNDVVGKSGAEAHNDKELRGQDGKVADYRNALGETIENKLLQNAVSGKHLYLTVDAEFQSYFYNRLKDGINTVGSRSGVGLAINPSSGEILALVNIPSFNSNNISESDLTSHYKPLFNRAVSGLYTPGSTIKPLVAVAALNEKIVSPDDQFFSAGYLEIPNPYFPDKPSRFLDWKPHGWVNLYSAIARSSNVYFYTVGGGFGETKGLGIEKLKEYWGKFGLGKKTGIDFLFEENGFLPDPLLKERNNKEIWRIGDTYNASIGQGDLLVTPLQLINYIAAIANKGKAYRPFVVKKIVSENGETIKKIQPEIIFDNSELSRYIEEAEKGMIDSVEKPYGTAHLLSDLPFSVAAKTGTSQVEAKTKINAFFVGYIPVKRDIRSDGQLAESSPIAVLILVENAREGGLNAVPVAKDVLNWYYMNRIK